MSANKDDLQAFFQKAKGISRDKVKYYTGWLDRFLEFYQGNLDAVSDSDVKAFGDSLEAGGCEHHNDLHACIKARARRRKEPRSIS